MSSWSADWQTWQACTREPSFGETKAAGWLAKDRSDKFRMLCVDNERKHQGSLPEADALVRWLDDALPPCKDRNLLVHEFGGHSTSMLAHSKFIPCAFEITNRAAAPLRSINSVTRGIVQGRRGRALEVADSDRGALAAGARAVRLRMSSRRSAGGRLFGLWTHLTVEPADRRGPPHTGRNLREGCRKVCSRPRRAQARGLSGKRTPSRLELCLVIP
jgi:hypothetical protein